MANLVFPAYKSALLTAESNVDIVAGTLKAVFLDAADYTYSSAHDFYDDVAAGSRVGTPQTIGTVSVSALGVVDGDNVTFSGLTGDPVELVLLFLDTGVESTSRLVALLDTATGLTLTPSGTDVTISWHASGIFQL